MRRKQTHRRTHQHIGEEYRIQTRPPETERRNLKVPTKMQDDSSMRSLLHTEKHQTVTESDLSLTNLSTHLHPAEPTETPAMALDVCLNQEMTLNRVFFMTFPLWFHPTLGVCAVQQHRSDVCVPLGKHITGLFWVRGLKAKFCPL